MSSRTPRRSARGQGGAASLLDSAVIGILTVYGYETPAKLREPPYRPFLYLYPPRRDAGRRGRLNGGGWTW